MPTAPREKRRRRRQPVDGSAKTARSFPSAPSPICRNRIADPAALYEYLTSKGSQQQREVTTAFLSATPFGGDETAVHRARPGCGAAKIRVNRTNAPPRCRRRRVFRPSSAVTWKGTPRRRSRSRTQSSRVCSAHPFRSPLPGSPGGNRCRSTPSIGIRVFRTPASDRERSP